MGALEWIREPRQEFQDMGFSIQSLVGPAPGAQISYDREGGASACLNRIELLSVPLSRGYNQRGVLHEALWHHPVTTAT